MEDLIRRQRRGGATQALGGAETGCPEALEQTVPYRLLVQGSGEQEAPAPLSASRIASQGVVRHSTVFPETHGEGMSSLYGLS